VQAEIDRVWLPRFLGSKTIGIQARRIVATTRHWSHDVHDAQHDGTEYGNTRHATCGV
jgi:hypothetical protein